MVEFLDNFGENELKLAFCVFAFVTLSLAVIADDYFNNKQKRKKKRRDAKKNK